MRSSVDRVVSDEVVSLGARVGRLAAERPDRPAVTCGDDTRTWLELDRETNRMARGLASHGVGEGDFVTIGLPNGVAFVEVCVACWKLGATPQPVSSRLPEAELDAIVALADPPVVVRDEPGTIAGRPCVGGEALTSAADGLDDDRPLPDRVSPAWKAPTSGGSTGRPKLIVSGRAGVVNWLELAFWRFDESSVAVMPGPLYHNGPFASAFQGLMAGAHLVVLPKFDAARTLEAVERVRATWLYVVPTMMSRIWRLPDDVRDRFDLSSLQTVWHLAAPCPPWLKQAWIEWLGGERIWELYAGTEAQVTTVITGTQWLEKRGSVGRPVNGDIRILDDDGREVPRGQVGEVFLRRLAGTDPTYRYIGAEPRARGDWESLGDLGWMDDDGFLYLADRRADMILVGGSNVYPAEVEAALDEHPLVVSSAVIGLPDDDLGQRVHAIVQGRAGLELDDLRVHLEHRLVRYKLPRSFEIVDEPVRDDAGKVRRSRLASERSH
jgi:bile acid-coenzyme A ligase